MIRVAGYCRVSTNSEDQANSFQSQQRYFQEYISRHPDWILYEIYADEGITGTSTLHREQFRRMIRDAEKGRIQKIVTKEVSRFSRNILDTIFYTRQLKELGVSVLFLLDGIDTERGDAELHLSIMASLAQEESRKISDRVTWGQTRQMEKGVVFGHSLLGYRVERGKITPEPIQAETVRLIFHKYAYEQMGTGKIAAFLSKNGYLTASGSENWHPGSVLKILKNEKYVGDLVQKKTFTPNYLTHKKQKNTGQVPTVCLTDHHTPIIERDLWNLAQSRLKERKKVADSGTHSALHAFSGKIVCGQCGSAYVCRYRYLKDGNKIRRWSCATAVQKGRGTCDVGRLLRDDVAQKLFQSAIRNLPIDRDSISDRIVGILLETESSLDNTVKTKSEIRKIQTQKEAMLESYFSGEIHREEMILLKQRYDTRINVLMQERLDPSQGHETIIRTYIRQLLDGEVFSNAFCRELLESILVYKDRHLEIRLKDHCGVFSDGKDCENGWQMLK